MKTTSLTWNNLIQIPLSLIKKKKSTFNLRNKDAATEIYMSSLEETLMKIEIPTHKCNNITRKERKALQDLENDKNIVIKGADRGH